MESGGSNATKKRMRTSVEEETLVEEVEAIDVGGDGAENVWASQMVEQEISAILEKINQFTEQVSELLESGKSMLKELGNEFEERMIQIHREQMEKWQDEIKQLRSLDGANEEIDALLRSARSVLQSVPGNT